MNWQRGHKLLLTLLISGAAAIPAQAQMKLGGQVETTRLDAILELGSHRKGLLLPRVTTATLTANPLDSAAQGMMVFNITDQTLYVKKANGYTAWSKVPDLSTYSLGNMSDVTFPVLPTIDQLLRYNGTKWSNWTPNYIKTISGAVTSAPVDAAGNVVTTLADFGTAGTYYKVTTDAKGRVQSGVTALVAADIPSGVTHYIQNQNAALQTGDFRIGGNGNMGSLSVTGNGTMGSLTATGNGTMASLTVTGLNVNGGLLFANGTGGVVAQKANQLVWDNTNNRLGIGNAAPSTALHVTGDLRVTGLNKTGGILFTSGTTGLVEQKDLQLVWDNTNNRLGIGTATPVTKLDVEGNFKLGADGSNLTNIIKGILNIPARANMASRAIYANVIILPAGIVLKDNDNIILNPIGTPTGGIFVIWARVTNATTREVTVAIYNGSGGVKSNVALDYNYTIISNQ